MTRIAIPALVCAVLASCARDTPVPSRAIAFSDFQIYRPTDLTLIGTQDWNW